MASNFIEIKSPEEVNILREASKIALDILRQLHQNLRVGVSTHYLDNLAKTFIEQHQVKSAFHEYKLPISSSPFAGQLCICLNNEVFHAPPSSTKIVLAGDLVTFDLGIIYKGFYADVASTFIIGSSYPEKQRLIQAAQAAFKEAVPLCKAGNNAKQVTEQIHKVISSFGFFPVEGFGGHGIGTYLHQAPQIPNSKPEALDCELTENMVICVEPACCYKKEMTKIGPDRWTVLMSPDNLSAHYERMVLVGKDGGEVL